MPLSRNVYVLGRRTTPAVPELQSFFERNRVAYTWVDVDTDPLVRLLAPSDVIGRLRLPTVVMPDGTTLEGPRNSLASFAKPPAHIGEDEAYLETARWRARLAEQLGLSTRPSRARCDLFVLGAGPAGLTAAVYAASEGLQTLVAERHAPGGQAGTSSRIENCPGFPEGIGGAELAEAVYEQAVRFEAEILVGVEVVRGTRLGAGESTLLELTNASHFETRAAVMATGVHYRRLPAPGVEELIGAGVFYGSVPSVVSSFREKDVFVVGAANSAGQAALHLADAARRVTLLVRGGSLDRGMSRYLIDRIERARNIEVKPRTEVARARGIHWLEELVLCDPTTGRTWSVAADALFVLIGGEPLTAGVEGWLRRDEHGFLMTGRDLLEGDTERRWWPLEREPLFLESSEPGVFVAGDVRHGSVKRVAAAVGEGSMAAQLIHRHLEAAPHRIP